MKCERKYTVYMHRNRFDDKKYFGITCRPVDERWQNGLGYKKNSHFYNSILKYGWDDGFDHVILAVGLEEECAKDIERLLIAVFNTQNSKFGYNLTCGGDENPMDNPVVRAKYDEAMKKVYADAEWLKNVREGAKKRSANPEYRKHHCEGMKKRSANPEWREKVRKVNQKTATDPEWKRKQREGVKKLCKKVLCVETNIVYDSPKDAIVSLNLPSHCGIYECCRGTRAIAGGYHWEYADKTLKHKYKKYSVQPRKKKILCVETGVIYDSAKEAMVSVGLKTTQYIFKCCRGKAGSAGGCHWEFADEISKNKYIPYEDKQRKKVLCVETKIIYNSLKEAGMVNGVRAGNISDCCCGRQKTAGGYHWEYA